MRATKAPPVLVRGYALLTAAVALGSTSLYAAVPSGRAALAAEDRMMENTSVVIYAAAVAVALVSVRRGRAGRSKAVAWPIAVLGAVAALDEIDWGRRLLDVDAPEVEGVQVDSSQRLLEAALLIVSEHGGVTALVALGLACVALAYRQRRRLGVLAGALARSLAFRFVLLWLGLGLLTAVGEDRFEPTLTARFAEELIELCAALALLWAALVLAQAGRSAPAATR
jgi:hypothetical protein